MTGGERSHSGHARQDTGRLNHLSKTVRKKDLSAAKRQREKREREREGRIGVTIFVSRETRDTLVETRWLPEWSEDDRQAVAQVLQVMVDNLRAVTRDGPG